MVCHRCILAVEQVLKDCGIAFEAVDLGSISITKEVNREQRTQLAARLKDLGFDLMDDRRSVLIVRIKTEIVKLVHEQDNDLKIKLSQYLQQHIGQDYTSLSSLFSDVEGQTIEKFYIAQKIEKVKELLVYDELSLSEIAYRLNYSSVAHLSSQFKKVTGLNPSHFKSMGLGKRKPLDRV